MVNNFLDKFRSGLKSIQSRQIIALLTKEKNNGNISSVEEFKQRLQDLTNKLANTTISPTLQLFLAEIGDVIDSESFNFMLERIQDDLESSFTEANDIDTVLESHEAIVNDVIIKNLELAVNNLESQIEALEFVNNTGHGFDKAVFNTFRVTQSNRSSFDQGVLFLDPKSILTSGPSTEALIDQIGEKLLLRASLSEGKQILSIRQIFDSQARQSEIPVELPDSDINNILDSTPGTYWTQSILVSKPQAETGLFTKLELELGTVQTINFLQIEPIILYPIDIYSISYIDENNQSQPILTNPVTLTGTQKLFFNTISTSKLQIVFRNKNYTHVQFEVKPESPLVVLQRDSLDPSKLVQAIRTDLLDVISSPVVKSVLGLDTIVKQHKKFFEYFIGFDNIEVGLHQFDETAILVTKSERVDGLGVAGIKTLERRPLTVDSLIEYTEDTQPSDLDTIFYASLEYYLLKRDYSITGALINSISIPVLPLNIDVIRHERLLLHKKSNSSLTTNDIGVIQFYTTDPNITVYRNGEVLDSVDIDPLVTDGWLKDLDNSVDTPGQGTRMSYAIQIQNPSPLDIYTVSYTPNLSTSNIIPQDLSDTSAVIVDIAGRLDAWLGKDNIIYFPPDKDGVQIASSLVNLVIVLRRNTANVTLTPVVEEYLLALGKSDPSKFGDNS